MLKPTILNVDDNDAGRYAISRVLQLAGFEVKEAATGTHALAIVQSETPHIVLLDVNLPDLNGLEVCRHIKSDPQTAAIPVLMMSASLNRDMDKVRGLEGGADAYLTGPLEPEVLIATIRALLRARQAEEEVQNSARRWQTTFDAIGDGVAVLDADGAILQCNNAMERIFGESIDTIVGRRCCELLGFSDGGCDAIPCASARKSGRRASSDFLLDDRWINLSSDPVLTDQGELVGTVCIFSDITDRKRVEQEIREAKDSAESADRAKDQFLAVLSHELRTPLTPVLTAVHAIFDDKDLPEHIIPYLDIIQRNVELEARLIDDLLDLTRIAREKLQLNLEAVDTHALMRHVLDMCMSDISTKKLQLTIDLNAPHHHVLADSARLQQVFWNLVKNAVKFTHEGSIMIRSTNPSPDTIELEMIDTGIGIEPHILPRIFNAFEQGEQNITRQFGGLGLGLAISKALIDRLGGSLTASSNGKNLGAAFTVMLRTVAPPQVKEEPPIISHRASKMQGLVRILLVDDHADTSRVMQLLLERRGYAVETASTVKGALDAIGSREYDLLVSDIGLPDGSGLDLIRKVHSQKPLKGIALSGFGMEEDIANSIKAGFTEHLTKPVSFKQLLDVIQQLTEEEG